MLTPHGHTHNTWHKRAAHKACMVQATCKEEEEMTRRQRNHTVRRRKTKRQGNGETDRHALHGKTFVRLLQRQARLVDFTAACMRTHAGLRRPVVEKHPPPERAAASNSGQEDKLLGLWEKQASDMTKNK